MTKARLSRDQEIEILKDTIRSCAPQAIRAAANERLKKLQWDIAKETAA